VALSANATLVGIGLVLVLAVASQLVAALVRIPSIVVLLPVGFIAGVVTRDVHPDLLLGRLLEPLVAIGVGLILFESGQRLRLTELEGGNRAVVLRLLVVGSLIPLLLVTPTVIALFGYDANVAAMIAAILLVSGPTVVMPLLAFVRPTPRLNAVLKWEAILIDPIGALIAVAVFGAVLTGGGQGRVVFHGVPLATSLAIGIACGVLAAVILVGLLRLTERMAPGLSVSVTLMVVVAAVVGPDLVRADAGLVAATVMGVIMAHQRLVDVSRVLVFEEELVQLLIGVLFILLAASVSAESLAGVLLPSLGLIAVLVVIVRPLIVVLATWRSTLSWRERALAAFVAPRGIVAAATASAFGLLLARDGIPQATKILPVVFVVIFGTVVLYGLASAPVARRLGVAENTR
jgi:NhaP-type Na+/H+ or K+/H+ antiporter